VRPRGKIPDPVHGVYVAVNTGRPNRLLLVMTRRGTSS
jgi:hypothetical protein